MRAQSPRDANSNFQSGRTVLVNASNLHQGGGVSVAASFLGEVAVSGRGDEIDVVASTAVDANLRRNGIDTASFRSYVRFDVVGIRGVWKELPLKRKEYDLVFSVFGPDYGIRRGPINVVGMAQGWVAYPRNEGYTKLRPRQRLTWRMKFAVQAIFFALADVLVVEAAHVESALGRKRLLRNIPVKVVPNCADSIFWDRSRWERVQIPPSSSSIRLGLASRAHPHKNLDVYPAVRRALRDRHGIDAEMLVTLDDSEWEEMSEEFRASVTNIGSLAMAQVPSFIEQLDGVLFPTLLESFSASPTEAAALGKPLFASDRPFLHETAPADTIWIDPLDPMQIAWRIAEFHESGGFDRTHHQIPQQAWTSRDRALEYLATCERDQLQRKTIRGR